MTRLICKFCIVLTAVSEGELERTTDLSTVFGQSINGTVGQHAFAQMEENPDSRKKMMRRTTAEQRLLEQKKR